MQVKAKVDPSLFQFFQMKNYIIVAIIIILVIVGVVWFKMKNATPVVPEEPAPTTEIVIETPEPAPVEESETVESSEE